MTFFKNIKNSIYNKHFYQNLSKESTSFTVKYVALLSLLLSLIVSVYITASSIQFVISKNSSGENELYATSKAFIDKEFPQNASFTYAHGKLTSKDNIPVYIPLSQTIKDKSSDEFATMEYIFIYDASSGLERADHVNKKAIILANRDGISMLDQKKNKVQYFSFSDVDKEGKGNFTVNKETVNYYHGQAFTFAKKIFPYALVFIAIAVLISVFLYTMFFMFFFALITGFIFYVIQHTRGKDILFGDAYKVALHADTLPTIVQTIMVMLGFHVFGLLFSYTLCVMIIVWVNVGWGDTHIE